MLLHKSVWNVFPVALTIRIRKIFMPLFEVRRKLGAVQVTQVNLLQIVEVIEE